MIAIHKQSGGVPRTINVICENALLTGFGLGRRPVDSSVIAEVCRDLDLGLHERGLDAFPAPAPKPAPLTSLAASRAPRTLASFPYLRWGRRCSRLVDAFKKAVEESGTVDSPSLVRDIVSSPDAMASSPWEFPGASPHLYTVAPPSSAAWPPPAPPRREPRRPTIASHAISAQEASEIVGRLFDQAGTDVRNRALVFSAVGAEGDSAPVSAMVAEVLSCETTASVCLVDANRVARRLHTYFQIGGGRGFSDVLTDVIDPRSDLVRVASNLSILPWGGHGLDHAPDFTCEQVHGVLQDLLTAFDFLIVDVAPAGTHRDAAVLGSLLDGVALVASANATRREPGRRTIEKLKIAGARVVGVVLADRTFPIPEAIYRKL